ncbi:MAG: hypothetical protein WB460_11890 [Candidatus Acidiferrales bacterium]
MAGLLSGLLFAPTCIFAQQQTTIPQKQERIEVLIAKTVVFITLVVDLDGRTIPGQGTGFLVAVPDARMGKDQGFIYLITNRHVAEAIDNVGGICRRYRILQTSVTWNLKSPVNGQRQHTETINNPPGLNWVFPEDDSVDLAAIPFGGDAAKYDVEFVSIADFITPELFHTQFDVGDKILFAGLFSPFEGANEIQPILRQGILSMLPDGPIPTTLCRPGTVYLADVHAIRGNSGSPVFMTPRSTLGGMVGSSNGVVPYGLLGVISGFENESENFSLQASTTTFQGSVQANSGISVIVPAYQLKNLLESAPLQKLRDQAAAALNEKAKSK